MSWQQASQDAHAVCETGARETGGPTSGLSTEGVLLWSSIFTGSVPAPLSSTGAPHPAVTALAT